MSATLPTDEVGGVVALTDSLTSLTDRLLGGGLAGSIECICEG